MCTQGQWYDGVEGHTDRETAALKVDPRDVAHEVAATAADLYAGRGHVIVSQGHEVNGRVRETAAVDPVIVTGVRGVRRDAGLVAVHRSAARDQGQGLSHAQGRRGESTWSLYAADVL